MKKDYKAKCRLIWGYVDKDKAKPLLVPEFECKIIPTHELVQEPFFILALPALTSIGQKSK